MEDMQGKDHYLNDMPVSTINGYMGEETKFAIWTIPAEGSKIRVRLNGLEIFDATRERFGERVQESET